MISHATCTAPTSPVPKELTKMKRKKKRKLSNSENKVVRLFLFIEGRNFELQFFFGQTYWLRLITQSLPR